MKNRCIKCKDRYYRNGFTCNKCNEECITCNNGNNCLTCNSTNFMRISDNKCYLQDELEGFNNKTNEGCNKCNESYYLKDNECIIVHLKPKIVFHVKIKQVHVINVNMNMYYQI